MKLAQQLVITISIFSMLIPAGLSLANEIRTQRVKPTTIARPPATGPAATEKMAVPEKRRPTAPQSIRTEKGRGSVTAPVKQQNVLPDLVVEKFTVTPDKITAGEKITMRAIVRNQGSQALRRIKLVYLDGGKRIARDMLSIRAGGVAHSEKKVALSRSGRSRLKVVADPDRRIRESDEKNNQRAKVVVVTDPPKTSVQKSTAAQTGPPGRNTPAQAARVSKMRLNPDLFPVKFTLNRKQITAGRSVVVQASFRNAGPNAVEDAVVKFYINDKQAGMKTISIPSNHISFVTFRHILKQVGTHTFSARIDPDNQIRERNEHNNAIEASVKVSTPEILAAKKNATGAISTARDDHVARSSHTAKMKPKSSSGLASKTSIAAIEKSGRRRLRPGKATMVKDLIPPKPRIGQTITFLLPQKNNTWLNGRTYEIKWIMPGKPDFLDRAVLKKVDGSFSKDITPANVSVDSGMTEVFSFSYSVPQNINPGTYRIELYTTDGGGNQKTAKSESPEFEINWRVVGQIAGKVADPSTLIVAGYGQDSPQIDYFGHTQKVHGSGQLSVEFYWSDNNGDLAGGEWTLEFFENLNWHKKSLKFSAYHPALSAQFLGSQGLARLKIPFVEGPMGTPIRFYVTDKAGNKSNVVTGTVNALKGVQLTPPAQIKDYLEFVAPAAGTPGGSNVPVAWVEPGDTYMIKLATQVLDPAIKQIPVELSLIVMPNQKQQIGLLKVPNDGKVFTYKWTVPKLAGTNDTMVIAASAPLVSSKPFYSGLMAVSGYQLELTTPNPGQTLSAGSTVNIGWNPPKKVPAGETLNFRYVAPNGYHKKINPAPVPVSKQAWQWQIDPAEVVPGPGTLTVFSSASAAVPVAAVPLSISFPSGIEPIKVSFVSPSQGKLNQWFAGGLELVKWKINGGSASNVSLELRPTEPNQPPLSKVAMLQAGLPAGQSYFAVPKNAPGGAFRLVAVRGDLGTVIGEGGVIEVVSTQTANSMLPQPDTKFSISKVSYNHVGGNASIDIQTIASAPFKLSAPTNQKVTFKISNYLSNGKAETAVEKTILYDDNPGLFPAFTFPAGKMGYNLSFKPDSVKPVTTLLTSQKMPSAPFSAGNVCFSRYYPKLQVWVDSTASDGKTRTAYYQEYLKNFSGLQESHHALTGETFSCKASYEW